MELFLAPMYSPTESYFRPMEELSGILDSFLYTLYRFLTDGKVEIVNHVVSPTESTGFAIVEQLLAHGLSLSITCFIFSAQKIYNPDIKQLHRYYAVSFMICIIAIIPENVVEL